MSRSRLLRELLPNPTKKSTLLELSLILGLFCVYNLKMIKIYKLKMNF